MLVKRAGPFDIDGLAKARLAERFIKGLDAFIEYSEKEWIRSWKGLVGTGNGYLAMLVNDKCLPVGAIGFTLGKELNNKSLAAQETFYYVDEEYRGTWSIKLIKFAEKELNDMNVRYIYLGVTNSPIKEKIKLLYERLGYNELSSVFIKELGD